MTEYISREAAIIGLAASSLMPHQIDDAAEALQLVPAADVVPVVRCGECKHWHRSLSDDGKIEFFNFSHCEKGHQGFPNFFCADGERKDGDGE